MNLKVRFSHLSKTDIGEIWDYIADDNILAADRTVERIITTCQGFADTPQIGRSRNEFRVGLRSFSVGNYLIFYRVGPEMIDILRILHGARKLEDLLEADNEETIED